MQFLKRSLLEFQPARINSSWPIYNKTCFLQHSCSEESLSSRLGSPKLTLAIKSSQAKVISSTLCSAELEGFSGGPARHVHIPQEPPEASTLALPQLPASHLLGEEESGSINQRHGSWSRAPCPIHPSNN